MQTEIVAGEGAIARAVELLRAGEIVALPTETVYGLAADALNADAVAKIFAAKERPRFNPLIVHLPNRGWLSQIASADDALMRCLADEFWPGPLTFVLPRQKIVPDLVTAGLETVAVRMSAHPICSEIIRVLDRPLAAPSANRFGRISPTNAEAVREELDGRVSLIVDGGATAHGIESTIIQTSGDTIDILRRGPITADALSRFGNVRERTSADTITAPGQLASHYAPRTQLIAIERLDKFSWPAGKRVGVMALRFSGPRPATGATAELSASGDLGEAATNLFRTLRELDHKQLDLIVAELVPEEGIGAAINDRLRRAAGS
ncbi:MAG: L-threonylcarbamoyladenylate synthase [Verrucomicrobiota bacterium]|nr:L-threonylcarbamoyladenylate synthase [Verrucomicrobiota bacterium]